MLKPSELFIRNLYSGLEPSTSPNSTWGFNSTQRALDLEIAPTRNSTFESSDTNSKLNVIRRYRGSCGTGKIPCYQALVSWGILHTKLTMFDNNPKYCCVQMSVVSMRCFCHPTVDTQVSVCNPIFYMATLPGCVFYKRLQK